MFFKEKHVSVSIPNSNRYEVFHKATFKIHKSGVLEVRGFISDAETSLTNFYAPGQWIQAWSWR